MRSTSGPVESATAEEIIEKHEQDIERLRAVLRFVGAALVVTGIVAMTIALSIAAIEAAQ